MIIGNFAKSVNDKSLTELFAHLWPGDHWILAPTGSTVFITTYLLWLSTPMTVLVNVLQSVYRKIQKYFSHLPPPLSHLKFLSLKGFPFPSLFQAQQFSISSQIFHTRVFKFLFASIKGLTIESLYSPYLSFCQASSVSSVSCYLVSACCATEH